MLITTFILKVGHSEILDATPAFYLPVFEGLKECLIFAFRFS